MKSNNLWGGLFRHVPTLSLEQKEELLEMMESDDPEEVIKFADTIKSVEEDLNELKNDEEHADLGFIEKAFAHYKKYTDDSTEREVIDNYIDLRCSSLYGGTGNHEEMRYRPEQFNKKLGPNGGWIMVIEDIPVSQENKPVVYSVYFAKPDVVYHKLTAEETHRRKAKEINVPYYRVTITIETGTKVSLWPHEYMRITDVNSVLEEVGNSFEVVRLGGDANYDNAKVHYLGTRGVDQSGVYRLMMGAVRSPDFIFFRILPGKPTEFWHHFITCLQLGASPEMAMREWQMLEAGMTHYPVKIINKTKLVDKVMKKGKNGKSVSDEMEELTVKQEQDENSNTVRKSGKKTNTKRAGTGDSNGKSNSVTRKKR